VDAAHDFGKNTYHSLEVTGGGRAVATGWRCWCGVEQEVSSARCSTWTRTAGWSHPGGHRDQRLARAQVFFFFFFLFFFYLCFFFFFFFSISERPTGGGDPACMDTVRAIPGLAPCSYGILSLTSMQDSSALLLLTPRA